MLLRQYGKFFKGYVPSIKFPDRHGHSTPSINYSGKKIKLTNREALGQAMS